MFQIKWKLEITSSAILPNYNFLCLYVSAGRPSLTATSFYSSEIYYYKRGSRNPMVAGAHNAGPVWRRFLRPPTRVSLQSPFPPPTYHLHCRPLLILLPLLPLPYPLPIRYFHSQPTVVRQKHMPIISTPTVFSLCSGTISLSYLVYMECLSVSDY